MIKFLLIAILFIKRKPIRCSLIDSFKIAVFGSKSNNNINDNNNDNNHNNNVANDQEKDKSKQKDDEKIALFDTSWKWILESTGMVHPKRIDFDSHISKFAMQETNSDARTNVVDIDRYLSRLIVQIKLSQMQDKTKNKVTNSNDAENSSVNITDNLTQLVADMGKNTNSNTVIKIISKSIQKIVEKQVYGSSFQRNPTVLVSFGDSVALRFGYNAEIDFLSTNGAYYGSYIPPGLEIHAASQLKYSKRKEFIMLGCEAQYGTQNYIDHKCLLSMIMIHLLPHHPNWNHCKI